MVSVKGGFTRRGGEGPERVERVAGGEGGKAVVRISVQILLPFRFPSLLSIV